ncbi:MAG: hypothetical protein J6C85_02170, partial [Alphaproteobacteria bacterium]|nr:hypothetical protein [Alphaproteobacteria bacterium]
MMTTKVASASVRNTNPLTAPHLLPSSFLKRPTPESLRGAWRQPYATAAIHNLCASIPYPIIANATLSCSLKVETKLRSGAIHNWCKTHKSPPKKNKK